jgi:hypothetical protein
MVVDFLFQDAQALADHADFMKKGVDRDLLG